MRNQRVVLISPDGSQILYVRTDADHLISNFGGEGEALTEHATSVSQIGWSPDGEWIYASSMPTSRSIGSSAG